MPGRDSKPIVLRDTTLREGIQIPGSRITLDQKREFIRLLEEAGIPEIEIGLPDGVAACLELADLIQNDGRKIRSTALIASYTNRWQRQIDQAVEHRIHRVDLLIPTSDYLLANPELYGLTPDQLPERLQLVIKYAESQGIEVGVGFIDSTRTPLERLRQLCEVLRKSGVSRLIAYDSVGIMVPSKMKEFVAALREYSGIAILVHCHNDYGMSTANSLAAVEGGATAIDVAVNGLGGRAGNAPMEEVVLALKNLYGIETGIRTDLFRRLSEFTEQMSGIQNSPLKPIVGDYCFAHLPVMHIRCIAGGNPSAFEPFPPEQVGTERTYEFTLPVDYASAVEPFIKKSGHSVTANELSQILTGLKKKGRWKEQEIIEYIHANMASLKNS
jgi:isopropylmalate/homocitrate/citramalate synthase